MTAELGVRAAGHVLVAALRGEVDHANATDLERDLVARTSGAEAVVLDLTAVTYLDSAGVTLLDHVLRVLGRRAVPVRIVVPEGTTARTVLRIVAFDEGALASEVDEALAALRG